VKLQWHKHAVSLFCRAALNSKGSYFALTSAAEHWCCITAHLYEEQISTGLIAVAQACCEPVLQSSTEQWGIYFILTSAAVHWCCITAHLYEEQSSIGAIAVAQACCEPVLQSSTEQ
jgi:hypothetical protein